MFVFIDADSWDLILRDSLRCIKKKLRKSLLRKKNAIKIATNSFPKNVHFKFQVYEKDRSQLRSQQDKKNFRSVTLVLLYQVKLNIARQNGYAKQNISFCCIF